MTVMKLFRILLLLCVISTAWAHGLRCFPTVSEEGEVVLWCYFRIDQPAADAEITARDPNGTIVFSGRTDADGIAEFTWPGPGPLHVVIQDQAGHRLELALEADRFPRKSAESADGQARQHIEQTVHQDDVADLHKQIRTLEAEVALLRAEAERREWLRIALALSIMLGIAGIGWGLSRKKSS